MSASERRMGFKSPSSRHHPLTSKGVGDPMKAISSHRPFATGVDLTTCVG